MIHLIYGTDTLQSRVLLNLLRERTKNLQVKNIYPNSNFNFKSLESLFRTNSIFGEQIAIFVEFNKTPTAVELTGLEIIKKIENNQNLVIWIGENLNRTHPLLKTLQNDRNSIIKAFSKKDSKDIFALIDLINSKNQKAIILLNKIISKDSDALLVLSFITSNFRNMLALKLKSSYAKGLHPFVQQKILAVEKNFTQDKIEKILEKIYETDLRIKSTSKDVKNEMFALFYYIIN